MRIWNKLLTLLLSDFMYSYRIVVHINIEIPVVVSLYIFITGKNTKDSHLSTLTFVFVSSCDVVYTERW